MYVSPFVVYSITWRMSCTFGYISLYKQLSIKRSKKQKVGCMPLFFPFANNLTYVIHNWTNVVPIKIHTTNIKHLTYSKTIALLKQKRFIRFPTNNKLNTFASSQQATSNNLNCPMWLKPLIKDTNKTAFSRRTTELWISHCTWE